MKTRNATQEEINQEVARDQRFGTKTMFRHPPVECLRSNAKNGVQHKRMKRCKVKYIDGVPHVRHNGTDYPLQGDAVTLSDGQVVVALKIQNG